MEELDNWIPQQMGFGQGYFHANHIQHNDPVDSVLRGTRDSSAGPNVSFTGCEQYARVTVSKLYGSW